VVQVSAALIAIPVALGGVYSLYHHHVSKHGVCETLRDKVLTVIDRSLAPSVKYVLVQQDVEQFQTKCAEVDPDVSHIFHVTITQLHASISREAPRADHPQAKPSTTEGAPPAPSVAVAAAPTVPPGAICGRSEAGEQRGWVALSRRDAGHLGESNFDGFPDGQAAPPPIGTRLHARRTIPV
jgi:hypothetical protein